MKLIRASHIPTEEKVNETTKNASTISMSVEELNAREFRFGIWKFTQQGTTYVIKGISREGILDMLSENGFYKRYNSDNSYVLIQDKSNVISEVSTNQIQDFFIDYIYSINSDLEVRYRVYNIVVSQFEQRDLLLKEVTNLFNHKFLSQLKIHLKKLVRDTLNDCRLFFLNGILRINSNEIKVTAYSELENECVWGNQIKPHNFTFRTDWQTGEFAKFLFNLADKDDERIFHMHTHIGYLCHSYFNDSNARAVIFYDAAQKNLDISEGGSGKSLLIESSKQVRNVLVIDGKKYNPSHQFMFAGFNESTQIIFFDDVKKDFDFEALNRYITDGLTIEKKGKDILQIPREFTPKFAICSNYVIKNNGSTKLRRQGALMVSNHYQKQIITGYETPIIDEHGGRFFHDWNTDEWDLFFSTMVASIQMFLQNGISGYSDEVLELRQAASLTSEDFINWISLNKFEFGIRYRKNDLFNQFVNSAGTSISKKMFTKHLKSYCQYKKWKYEDQESNGVSYVTISKI